MGFIYLGILSFALAVGGMTAVQHLWNLTLDAARRVLASRIFVGLLAAIITALALPIIFALIGLTLRQSYGPDIARTIIFTGTILSMAVLGAVAFFARFLAEVIVFLFPLRVFEKIRNGIYYTSAGTALWILFIDAWLMVLGVFASTNALAALLIGGLLYWTAAAYYNLPTTWFPKVAITTGLVLMLWFVGSSIPTSFWMATVGTDLRPVLQLHSGIDNVVADAAERARWERERELCSQEIERLERELKLSADLETVRNRSEALETMKRTCSQRTAFWR